MTGTPPDRRRYRVLPMSAPRSVPNSPGSFLQYLKHVTKTVAADPLTVVVETDGPDPILLNELQNVLDYLPQARRPAPPRPTINARTAAIGTGPYRVDGGGCKATASCWRGFDGYFGAKADWEKR